MSRQTAKIVGLFFYGVRNFQISAFQNTNVQHLVPCGDDKMSESSLNSIPRLGPLRKHVRIRDFDATFVQLNRAAAFQFLE